MPLFPLCELADDYRTTKEPTEPTRKPPSRGAKKWCIRRGQ
jgi:hypothetical protein